jgi:hypothetical protein
MNNSVFGKTMKNIRKRVNIQLVNDINRRNKLVSDDDFISMKMFYENLVTIQRPKTNLKLNKINLRWSFCVRFVEVARV